VQTKSYGRLSVLAQLVCRIDRLTDLNPECFVPAPKIRSTVLLFRPRTDIPSAAMIEKIEQLTNAAFSQRRKMIRRSLCTLPKALEACERLNIALTCRAEELTPEQYLRIAENL
jgi:16S rRNA (adenine1518-N6/adenine1519-N6)-dimethyltransferase